MKRGDIYQMFQRLSFSLHREWQMNYAQFLITLTLLVIFITCFPFISTFKFNDYLSLSLVALFAMILIIPIQFILNLRNETKNVDLWLHTTSSFRELILSKIVFYLIISTLFSLTISIYQLIIIGIYHQEKAIQFVPLYFSLNLLLVLYHFSMFNGMLLVIYFILLLNKYIGNFAYLVVLIGVIIFIIIQNNLIQTTLYIDIFESGFNFTQLIQLPEIYTDTILYEIKKFLYVKEIVLSLTLSILIMHFIITPLERVFKR